MGTTLKFMCRERRKPMPKYLAGDKVARLMADVREKRVAAGIGGRQVPGSGCSMYAKGDVKDTRFGVLLIEQKGTEGKTISVAYDWIRKITREAEACGRIPALALSWDRALAPGEGVPPDWLCLPMNYVRELMENQGAGRPPQ